MNLLIFAKQLLLHSPDFTNQPNLIVNSGTHLSLHDNCQHQITLLRPGLELNTLHLINAVWTYAKTNVYGINKAISQFNFQEIFTNLPVNEQVYFFNSTLMNIFQNFITTRTLLGLAEILKLKSNQKIGYTRNTLKMVDEKLFIIYCKI